MSSLLKINQKFLSKSSWSIRGSGNSNNSNGSNNRGNHRSSVPYSVNSTFAISPLNQSSGNQKISANNHTFDNKRRPYEAENNPRGGEVRLSGAAHDKRQTLHYDSPRATAVTANRTSKPSAQIQLVNNHHHLFVSQSSPLKRSKGMSHSITDLRELKEKPKKNFIASRETDEFQHEIKERRIDMYIAEIEMEPLFQLGSTIRWASCTGDVFVFH